jgi:hypothetical protein
MKSPKVTEIRGFDLFYPASGQVVEIRGPTNQGGRQTRPPGRVVVLKPRPIEGDASDYGGRAGREPTK